MKKIYYVAEDGTSPVGKFLDSVPKSIKARFYRYLDHLAAHDGKLTRGEAFKKLHGYPMEEIRVKQSHNLHRVIIHVQLEQAILILHGFTKKEGTPTPQKEIDIALERFSQMKKSLKS